MSSRPTSRGASSDGPCNRIMRHEGPLPRSTSTLGTRNSRAHHLQIDGLFKPLQSTNEYHD